MKRNAKEQDAFAWLIGSYVYNAIGCALNSEPYISEPRSVNSYSNAPKGEVMTDGARFAAFASVHNRQIAAERRNNK